MRQWDLCPRQRINARILAAILLPFTVSACLLVPGEERSSVQPLIEGAIRYSGEPVGDRQIFVRFATRQLDCAPSISDTRTDTDGRFTITPQLESRKYRLLTFAPSSPTYFVAVCLEDSVDLKSLFAESYYGAPPPLINLQCEIDQSAAEGEYCTVAKPQAWLRSKSSPGLIGQGSYLQ